MIFRILLYAFLVYVLYKIIFDIVIPIYKATRQVKKGFREMSARMNRSDGHNRMNDYINKQQEATPPNNSKTSSNKSASDYIEFEEIK